MQTQASSVAMTANVAALEEIDRKLKLCDNELDLVNRFASGRILMIRTVC